MDSLSLSRDSTVPALNTRNIWSWDKKGKSGLSEREWNAFIGIVTAIVGNILISFALNLQRYAHIKLNRDKLRRQKSWASNRRNKLPKNMGYGTQSEIANERAELNRNAPQLDEEDEEHITRYHGHDNDETTPLNGTRRVSDSSSSSTVKPGEKFEDEDVKTTTYLKSGYWWAGIVLMTCGEAGNFLAYGFAPASIVSPLGVVALISNCIIAPCLLKERFRQRDLWGVVVAVGGAVTVVLSAENGEKKMGPHAIWEAITRWEFELYLGLTIAAIIALMWASGKYGDRSILIDLGLVGLFGGYTALTTKGVASLLSDTLWRVITFPVFYLLVFILIATALLQIRYVNRALQRFDSTQVIPTQFVLFTLSVIIGSAVLYRDFEKTSAARMGKFVGGCFLTFSGVFLITSGRGKGNDEEEDGDLDEEGIRLVDEEVEDLDAAGSEIGDGDAVQSTPFNDDEPMSSTDHSSSPSRQQSYNTQSMPRTPQRLSSYLSTHAPGPFTPAGPFTPGSIESPHGENPWATSQEELDSQSRLVPTSADIRRQLSSSSSRLETSMPVTPSRGTDSPQRPGSNRDDRRNSSFFRKALVYPGPLISPLSSSLSGIVQDNLRRGVDSPSKSMRRKKSGLSRLRSAQESGQNTVEERPLLNENALDVPPEGRQRSRSISDALGSLFRRKSNKSKGSLRDEESGIASVNTEQERESSHS